MKQIKIGAITIGQAPRTDITRDILPLLPDYMTLTEYGALDDMTYEEVMSQFAPSEDDEVLVSRMRDGRQAKFTERFIRPLVQQKIDQAEAEGVSAIILFCTGVFPEFRHKVLSLNLSRFSMLLQPNWQAIKKSASLFRNRIRWSRLIIPGAKAASL